MPSEHALYWLWAVWYASWLISLFWAGKPQERLRFRQHWLYQVVTMLGVIGLFGPPSARMSPFRLWLTNDSVGWILFGLTAFSFLFCWWARIEMGKLWSGFISRNANHRIVSTGPFSIVRHPIYTGVIAAAFLMAIELGTAVALGGAVMFALAFWMKARLEEQFLREQLGPQAYDAYRRSVPMLLPLGRKSA
jgi:protein-S-isoprenylcysteine O-methyltransferase Ste14